MNILKEIDIKELNIKDLALYLEILTILENNDTNEEIEVL